MLHPSRTNLVAVHFAGAAAVAVVAAAAAYRAAGRAREGTPI
ncbi:MAG: hypothetical protein RBU25_20430 [Lentisphaeria bacterium]|nr:hypothetical protein [Lentisphaeria bacterium]